MNSQHDPRRHPLFGSAPRASVFFFSAAREIAKIGVSIPFSWPEGLYFYSLFILQKGKGERSAASHFFPSPLLPNDGHRNRGTALFDQWFSLFFLPIRRSEKGPPLSFSPGWTRQARAVSLFFFFFLSQPEERPSQPRRVLVPFLPQ